MYSIKGNSITFYIISTCLVCLLHLVKSRKYDWATLLSEKINEDVKPPVVVLFGDVHRSNQLESLFEQIEAPVINIQSAYTLNNNSKNALFDFLILKHSRSPNLYVILENGKPFDSFLSRIEDSLRFIAELFPTVTRPKCLLILHDTDTLSNDHFAEVLLLAWRYKFLDFSMIRTNDEAASEIWNYNPFSNTILRSKLTAEIQIFTDKLENMHGYTLKFPLIHFPPNGIVKNESGTLTASGARYAFYEIFSKQLNFELDVIPNDWKLNTLSYNTEGPRLYRLFAADEIDGLTVAVSSIFALMANRPYTMGYKYFSNQVAVTVPILRADIVEFPGKIGLELIILVFLAISIRLVAKFAKLSLFDYGIMDMYRNFLGWPARNNTPTRRFGKISLISIFVVSLVVSSGLFTTLTSIRIVHKELELDTFEQMNDANLTLCVPRYMEKLARNNENVDFQKLFDRGEIVDNIPDSCFSKIIQTMNRACVSVIDFAQFYIGQQRSPLPIKISKTLLHSDMGTFPFQKASPYVDKLSVVQQRIIESGLPKFRIPKWGYEDANSTYDSEEHFDALSLVVSHSQILNALVVVSIIGFGTAFLVFIIEQFHHFCRKE